MAFDESQNKKRNEGHRRYPMPGVQVAITEIGKKTAESGHAAQHEQPPGPGLALPQRKFGQPDVQGPHGDQSTAERYAIMEHEQDYATVLDAAELFGRHTEKLNVMWQKVTR